MFLHNIEEWLCDIGESMEVKLPRKGLKLDPRVNWPHAMRFDIDYHDDGITVTLTRMNDDDCDYDDDEDVDSFSMRAYDPEMETVPDFTSTIYVYMGLDGEHPPSDTTLVFIHPSVKIIKSGAFDICRKLRRVIMNEYVEIIEEDAFNFCHSLDAVFLPSSIKKIGHDAFFGCLNLQILSIPQTINIDKIGKEIIYNCHTFFRITQIPPYELDEYGRIINNNQVNQAIIDFNHNLPPLHKVCLNTNVTAQSIHQCIDTHGRATAYNTDYRDGMAPMHILALNPHAATGAILTLFHANMGMVFEPYSEGGSFVSGKTPLECLAEHDVDSYLSVIAALCMHREIYSSPTVEESMRNKRQKLN